MLAAFICGSYWIRTSDPPDCRSGCSGPTGLKAGRTFLFRNKLFNFAPAFPGLNLSLPCISLLFGGVSLCVNDYPVLGLPGEPVVTGQMPS